MCRQVAFIPLKGDGLVEHADWLMGGLCLYCLPSKSEGGWCVCGVTLHELGLVWLYAHAVVSQLFF